MQKTPKKITSTFSLHKHTFSTIHKTPNTLHITTLPPKNSKPPLITNFQLQQSLSEMCIQGFNMRSNGYNSILNECINLRAVREGQRIQAHMMKTNNLIPYMRTRLLVFYNKCDVLSDARLVFDEMPERNVVSWTAMISVCSKRGLGFDALFLFVEMLRSGIEPNEFTFATILTSCTGTSGVVFGMQIHSHIIKSKHEFHIFVGSSLLDMYAKAEKIHEAKKIFEGLPERDVVSCTAIISGYAQLGHDEEALKLYRRLLSEGMTSNYVTYASVLTALSGLSAFDHGKQVHGHVIRRALPFYVVLQNSLIDMYAKCGNLTYSRIIFNQMTEKTTKSWNAMLVGYSKHGMGKEVIELFNLMTQENKVNPDCVTFLAVLSGCSHGGMVNEGLEIFNNMVGKYECEHDIDHYGCIVDLLARAGRVEKAYEFMKQMPFKPNSAILGSLLGACKVHSNIDIGEVVGHQLLEIEPENDGNYIILSNLYASVGRWEDVRCMRDLMKEKEVMKKPGKSWIELDQILHTFHSSERSHPKKEETFAKVRELSAKIQEVCSVPDLSCVLYDVDSISMQIENNTC